jgi:hypothetical protein
MRVRNAIFLIIFRVPKQRKFLKIVIDTKNGLKSFIKIFFTQIQKKFLKIRLSIRVRNFAAPSEPLNI